MSSMITLSRRLELLEASGVPRTYFSPEQLMMLEALTDEEVELLASLHKKTEPDPVNEVHNATGGFFF